MDRVPNEIIWMIVERSCGRLAPLATISRRWQEPVERRLFHKVELRVKEPKEVERSTKWCRRRKIPETELDTEDEDDWEDDDSEKEKYEAENKTREMEEVTLTQFDSFRHVFEGPNSYRQKYLRQLWFQVTVPYSRVLLDVAEDEKNQDVFHDAVHDLFSILEGWNDCENLEFSLATLDGNRTRNHYPYQVSPFDPVDWDWRLMLGEIRPKIPFITSFSYMDNTPIRVLPGAACGLTKKFPNLQELELVFDNAEDPDDHEYRDYIHDRIWTGLKKLRGYLPRLRKLQLSLRSYYLIEREYEPIGFIHGDNKIGEAVRWLAQPTAESLTVEGFFLSPEFFGDPDSDGSGQGSNESDKGGWRDLRHLNIDGHVVGADGKYFLKSQKNWTSNVSSFHPQGDAATLDRLVGAFYASVLRMPLIQVASLGLASPGCQEWLYIRAEADKEGRDALRWFSRSSSNPNGFRREEIFPGETLAQ